MATYRGELQVDGLCKDFLQPRGRTFRAVDSVTFGVRPGEVCALLGPSGCGKSTVLRMVAGLETRTAGRILVSGRQVSRPGRDRGMVFQSYTSFPWLTVKQNVEYGLKVNGSASQLSEGAANYFLDRVKLTPFRDQYPDQLSGGMRQRVAIARTLANGPELLLMDEPFGALDAETRWQMQELLLEIVRKEHMTVLVVTHDVEEALYLADNIVFLSRHPGHVREIIRPNLDKGEGQAGREALWNDPAYGELKAHIIRMLRREGTEELA